MKVKNIINNIVGAMLVVFIIIPFIICIIIPFIIITLLFTVIALPFLILFGKCDITIDGKNINE